MRRDHGISHRISKGDFDPFFFVSLDKLWEGNQTETLQL